MELTQYIQTYFGIDQRYLSTIAELFEIQPLSKGDFLLKQGQAKGNLSFLQVGYLRFFATPPHSDKEVTQWIGASGAFVGDLANLIFDTPARWNIQALTDCELYMISQDNYRKIETFIPQWHRLEKLFIAKCFITLEQRIFDLLSLSAEQRYDSLMQQDSHLFNAVPLQYLAAMLHMTPETLSRIRQKNLLDIDQVTLYYLALSL